MEIKNIQRHSNVKSDHETISSNVPRVWQLPLKKFMYSKSQKFYRQKDRRWCSPYTGVLYNLVKVKVNVKFTLEQITKGQRLNLSITTLSLTSALDLGGWSTPCPGRFTPRKDPVIIVWESGWAPGPVWTGAENLASTGIRSPDRSARSQSIYRLRYLDPFQVTKDALKATFRRRIVLYALQNCLLMEAETALLK